MGIMLIVVLMLAGCAGTLSSLKMGPNESTAVIFPVSSEVADRLVVSAMIRKCPNEIISRVEFPNKGYQLMLYIGLDHHRIIAFYIPAQGRNAEGEIVPGFIFEVDHQGTTARGVIYANDIFEMIIEDATRVAKPILFVGYK